MKEGRAGFRSDVNVGGPDGQHPDGPPELTVGTVMLHYVEPPEKGVDPRRWLWNELDDIRKRYEALWPVCESLRIPW